MSTAIAPSSEATAAMSAPPDAKKMRLNLPLTQVVVSPSLVCDDHLLDAVHSSAASPAAPSSSNSSAGMGEVATATDSDDSDSTSAGINSTNIIDFISQNLMMNSVFKMEDMQGMFVAAVAASSSVNSALKQHQNNQNSSHSTTPAPPVIPGALAVAQSPTAALFPEGDWSWHRNPAASIRSGGTNKQTPVWKYFVYNKTENLSRCIINDCTYMLKGPHTSTLACHLKKHPEEYAEYQKLKSEYTRDRNGVNLPPSPSSSSGGSSTTSARPNHVKMEERNSHFINIQNALPAFARGPFATPSATPTPGSIHPSFHAAALAAAAAAVSNANSIASSTPAATPPFSVTAPITQHSSSSVTPTLNSFHKQKITVCPNPPNNGQTNAQTNAQTNGQIKKWRKDERKQKDLENRLAFFLSSARLNSKIIADPFLKDLLEAAQPKFSFPEEPFIIEQILAAAQQRMHSQLRGLLSSSRRLSLLLDINRLPLIEEAQPYRLAISASFASSPFSNQLELILLAVRPFDISSGKTAETLRNITEQVLADYGVSMERVARIVTSGLEEVLESSNSNVFGAKQLVPYNKGLHAALLNVVETSPTGEELRKDFYSMVLTIVTRPGMLAGLTKAVGHVVSLSWNSYLNLMEAVLAVKKEVLGVFESYGLQGITDQQWKQVECVCSLFSRLELHKGTVEGGGIETIDTVVPGLMQMLVSLDKDEPVLGPLSNLLKEELLTRVSHVLEPSDAHFDGSYLQATALNPQLVVLLDDEKMSYVRSAIEAMLQERMRVQDEAASRKQLKSYIGVDALLASVIDRRSAASVGDKGPTAAAAAGEVAANLGAASSLYPDLMQAAQLKKKSSQERANVTKNRYAEAIVQTYLEEVCSEPSSALNHSSLGSFSHRSLPPPAFWQLNLHRCPELAELAAELLATPATTPGVERVFASRPFDPLSLLGPADRLERDTLLRFNRSLATRNFSP